MPSVDFACPDCRSLLRVDFADESVAERSPTGSVVVCHHCQRSLAVPAPVYDQQRRMSECLVCPSRELFVRKDFPQRLGVAIVVLGFGLSSVAWAYYNIVLTFGILLLTAAVDVVLYVVMGDVLECYRCHAQYRQVPNLDAYQGFDLEIHERHRQQEIRLQEHQQQLARRPASGEQPKSSAV